MGKGSLSMERVKVIQPERNTENYMLKANERACTCPDYLYRESIHDPCKHLKAVDARDTDREKLPVVLQVSSTIGS